MRNVAKIAAMLLCLAHLACSKNSGDVPRTVAVILPDAPDELGRNTTLLFTDSNSIRARLVVGRARKYNSRLETLLDSGVYVEFFDPISGTPNAVLVADSAHVDDRSKDMIAYGRVHVHSDTNRTTVDTDRLFYSNASRKLSSDAKVHIVDSANLRILDGVGFESDQNLENYKIFNASGRTISR